MQDLEVSSIDPIKNFSSGIKSKDKKDQNFPNILVDYIEK